MTTEEKGIIDDLKKYGIDSYKGLRDAVIGENGKGGIYNELINGAQEVNKKSVDEFKTMADEAIKKMNSDPNSVKNKINEAYNAMEGANKQYADAVKTSVGASQIDWTNLDNIIKNTYKDIDTARDKVINLTNTTSLLSNWRAQVDQLGISWNNVYKNIESAVGSLASYLTKLNEINNTPQPSTPSPTNPGPASSGDTSTNGNTSTGGNTGSGGGGSTELGPYDANLVTSGNQSLSSTWYSSVGANKKEALSWASSNGYTVISSYDKKGGSPNGNPYITVQFQEEHGWKNKDGRIIKTGFKSKEEAQKALEANSKESWKAIGYTAFASGGYTGDWDDNSGRVALLHSKELVLNQDDTKNLLDTVGLIRSISASSFGQSIQNSIMSGIASIVASMLNFGPSSFGETINNTNKSNIFNITAEFPNANSVAEIQEAILNLPTLASQYLSQR